MEKKVLQREKYSIRYPYKSEKSRKYYTRIFQHSTKVIQKQVTLDKFPK